MASENHLPHGTSGIREKEMRRRLTGWKEIGAYFGKNERTVKRWESQRGLPIHRPPGGAKTAVFADVLELEDWLKGSRATAALAEAAEPVPGPDLTIDAPAIPEPIPAQEPARRSMPGMVAVLVLLAAIGAALLIPALRQAPASHQPPVAASQLYFSGLYHWNTRTAEGLKQSLDEFKRAIAIDPKYAAAYAGLGNAYNLLAQYDVMPAAAAYPLARQAAERAITLDPAFADGYSALGFALFYGFRDLDRAEELFQKALALDPGSSRTLHWYALVMMHTGRFEEPLRAIDRAQALDPNSHAVRANRGLILFYAGRTDEAIEVLSDLAQSAPNYMAPHYYLATIYLDLQRYDDYLRETRRAVAIDGNPALKAEIDAAAEGYRAGGVRGLFAALLAAQQREHAAGRESAFNIARTAALLGETGTALAALEQARATAEPDLLGIRIDRAFKSLRDDARFQKLADSVLALP